ncbi:MAG: long-chain-fatty-acid--CoA ligase [Steroidobacteraceae bacterium]|jgi:fatty-acyl-CoA synthase|nr:long-chain-fatty-acid--CoA ligase [Steroidobacteraceae bacterium]
MPVRMAEPAAEAYRYPLLVRHLLHAPLATAREQVIVYGDRRRHSYLEFANRIERLAGLLTRFGAEPGATVAVLDWDSHRYLECFFAVPMLGAVLQTVNVRLSPDQVAYTMSHARAEIVLLHRDFLPLYEAIRDRLPGVRHVVLLDDDEDASGPGWLDGEYEQCLAAAPDGYRFADFDENAVATTFYTTGTTGDPKGVCFSHRQLVLHTLAVMAALAAPAHGQSFRHGDVYMPMTPMFHVHAWGNPFVATVLGVKQVYPGRYVPDELISLRRREGVTYSHCVPTILQMLLARARERNESLAGWKICIGGSALPAGLAREALEAGIDVFAGYGMSETGPVMTVTRLNAAPGSMPLDAEIECRRRTGLPIPLVDLQLLDVERNVLPADDVAVGEVTVRAPWTTPCYVGNPEASDDLWRGGRLHTQDVGRIGPGGFLQVTDRIKDVIKTGGEWLSSLELETLISMHPDVAEVAVIGVTDARWGERPHAIVVPRAEARGSLTADDVRRHVAEAAAAGRIPKYAVPERVTLTDALDRTSVGKLDKRSLRRRFN